ncbi:MAG: FAD-dependent monooxygenase [Caldimonas sp.]
MKITVVGGGPGGLNFALLTKKRRPDWSIEVHEQNPADDTFGFGVVFSDETLDEFLQRDPPSYDRLRAEFAYWDDVAIHFKGHEMHCAGNGFCGTSRAALLRILQQRCREVGVTLHFGVPVPADRIWERFVDSDIIVASDGVNSSIRQHFQAEFRPAEELKSNRFCWMGSTRPMGEFNYFFRDTGQGVICAHTYQYGRDRSTWVFETSNACWEALGFTEFDEEASRAKLEAIFADELAGHPLLLNRSHWRRFPRVFCERWWFDNVVILGDAKASAHFSVGSGTKLAMECAISLSDAVVEHGERSVHEAFAAYDAARRTVCQVTQHNADVSLAWFEHIERSWDMDPYQFAMVVMCRAKSITYDNLLVRDPNFVARVDDAWYERHRRATGEDLSKSRPTPMFTPLRLRGMQLSNRLVMSPMAQYSCDADGNLGEWSYVHYTSHALGGMGLIYTEMVCPSPDARISLGCPGLWSDAHEAKWREVVDFVHAHTDAKVCLQLGHAGRKGATQLGWEAPDVPIADPSRRWPLVAASAIPYVEGVNTLPAELDAAGMQLVIDAFVQATRRAAGCGFDMLELHCAHGYLLASFVSPLTNRRDDAFGGSPENRMRFPLQVFEAMRAAWPAERPMSVRISATDWKDGGVSEADMVAFASALAQAGCDLVDVSAGQTVADQEPVYGRMFQVQFADAIRNVVKMATMAVGAITEPAQVNTILHTRRADLVAIGRPHLWNPYFGRQAAAWYGARGVQWPRQYLPGAAQAYREMEKARADRQDLQRRAKPKSHAGEPPQG